jgi:hypothetical protein
MQIEEMLRAAHAKLERHKLDLTAGLSMSETATDPYADARHPFGPAMNASMGSHSSMYGQHPYASSSGLQRQPMHPNHELDYRAMYPRQPDMMQPGSSGAMGMIAIPSRKPTPKSLRQQSIREQPHSMHSMPSMHLQHAHSGMALHPQHMAPTQRHPSPAHAALPAHVMPQYMPPGMPMHGMYGYAPPHAQVQMQPHDGAVGGQAAQYFVPVESSFKGSSSRPQVRWILWHTSCALVYAVGICMQPVLTQTSLVNFDVYVAYELHHLRCMFSWDFVIDYKKVVCQCVHNRGRVHKSTSNHACLHGCHVLATW